MDVQDNTATQMSATERQLRRLVVPAPAVHDPLEQVRAGPGQVLVHELGEVDTGASGHRSAALQVGCRL